MFGFLVLTFGLAACDSAFEVADEPGIEDGLDGGHGDGEAGLPDPCPPPADPQKAALCLVVEPEAIDFIEDDERFDGKGILHVGVFDKARPGGDGALDERTRPPQGNAPVVKPLSDLVAEPIRFELTPGTVYPRALFLDDLAAFGAPTLKPGMWFGGFDFEKDGLDDDAPLLPVNLEAGKGQEVTLTLTALRHMEITLSRGNVMPIGNGQGPLLVVALDSKALDGKSKTFGVGTHACANLLTGPSTTTVEGVVLGKGPYWVTAVLDDFGQNGSLPAGALVSFDWQTVQIPAEDELSYAPRAYRVAKSIEMTAVMPAVGSPPDQVTCGK